MRSRLCAALLAGIIIGFGLCLLSLPANALGFPIPQPKPCVNYWDSKRALNIAKHHPFSSGRYLSDPHFTLFGTKDGGAVMLTHDKKGCLRTYPVAPHHAAKLLSDQENS